MIFDQYLPLSRKEYKIAIGTIKKITRNSYAIYQMVVGAIFHDVERLLVQISKARHYSTLNILETVHDKHTGTI